MKNQRSYFPLVFAFAFLISGASVAIAQDGAAKSDQSSQPAAGQLDVSKLTQAQIAHITVASVAEQLLVMYRQAGDSERALWALERLAKLRPNVGSIHFQLALTYAAMGEKTKTYDKLIHMQSAGYGYDLDKDPRFAKVADTKVWDYIVKNLKINLDPFGEGKVAFKLPGGDQLFESIAYDPGRKGFLVGSARDGTVSRVDAKGHLSDFIKPNAENGLWSVYALGVDAKHDALYVASTASVYFKDLPKTDFGKAGVFKFRLSDGKFLHSYLLPAEGSPHTLSSMTVGPTGQVFVADGVLNQIWRLDGDSLKMIWSDERLTSVRGMAVSDDGKTLYFADHALGIFGIDLAKSRAFDMVYDPESLVLGGIEGMYWYDHTLVVIESDMQPKRVMRLTIADDGRTITKAMPLDSAAPEFTLPTVGAVDGDMLYFIANSQRNQYDTYGAPKDAAKLQPVVIYRSNMHFAWDEKGINTQLQKVPTATPEQRKEFLKDKPVSDKSGDKSDKKD